MTTPEPRTPDGTCPGCGVIHVGRQHASSEQMGVVPAPDVEAAWEALIVDLPIESVVMTATKNVVAKHRPLIEAALRGSGARPEPVDVERLREAMVEAWADRFGMPGPDRREDAEKVAAIYNTALGARPKEGLRAAAERMNRVLTSMTGVDQRAPVGTFIAAINAARDAYDAARGVGAIPTTEADAVKVHAEGPGHHYSLDDCRAALGVGAIPVPLDVERLREAMSRADKGPSMMLPSAADVAAEYDALGASK